MILFILGKRLMRNPRSALLIVIELDSRYLNSHDLAMLCRGLSTSFLGNLLRSLHGYCVTLSLLGTERSWICGGALTHILNNILVVAGRAFYAFTLKTPLHLSTGTVSSTL